MNRFEEIEQFLDYYKRVYQQNPNLPITSDVFYNGLMTYDSVDDKNQSVRPLFSSWVDRYSGRPLAAYVHPNQTRFLQFANDQGHDVAEFKLYINSTALK